VRERSLARSTWSKRFILVGGYDPPVEFAWGLDLILDGFDRLRREA